MSVWRGSWKRRGLTLVLVGLLCAFTGWVFLRSAAEFWDYHWAIRYEALALAFLVYSVDLWLATVAWHTVCRVVMGEHPYLAGTRGYVTSLLFRRLPSGLFGIGSRLYLYEKMGRRWPETATAMAIEWVSTVIAGGLVGLTYVVSQPAVPWPGKIGLLAVGIAAAGVAQPRLIAYAGRRVSRSWPSDSSEPGVSIVHISGWQSAGIVGLYALVWIWGGLLLFVIVRALAEVPMYEVVRITGLWALAGTVGSLVVILPSGLGLVEMTLGTLLIGVVSAPVAAASAIGMRLVVTVGEFVWTVIIWWTGLLQRRINGGVPTFVDRRARKG